MNGRERVLATIEGRPVDHLAAMPITMMFAGDQIGVPYREYATDHRALVEAQVRTAERFGLDYVSAISDPAREAADCGAAVEYLEDQPPALDAERSLLADKARIASLDLPDPLGDGRMLDRVRAIEGLRARVGERLLVEGWVEGPCAEGADLRGLNTLMFDFYDDPDFVAELFELTLRLGLRFARAQIEAGADLIGVGDAAASLVGPGIYREHVLPREQRLVDGIHELGGRARLHICGNTRAILADMASLECEIVDLDYPVPVAEARAALGPDRVLLGNIDPVRTLRDLPPGEILLALDRCHREAGPRFIVGAGCEVTRDTPASHLEALVGYARSHRPGEPDLAASEGS